MGTTSQKLSYLNDTKGKLKDSINKFRNGITNQTTFRDYATELDGIYDKLPKVDNTSDASQLLNAQNGLLDDFKMYGNTIQGRLPSGYTQVDYITSSGSQYIDTGVNADTKLRVILDMAYINPTGTNQTIGAIKTGTPNKRYHLLSSSSTIAFWINDTSYNIIQNSDTNRHFWDLNVPEGKVVLDNTTTTTIATNIDDVELSFWLFGRNSNASQYKGAFKIWACKMYYNGTLVRDFIPCYRNSDNEIGLYDLVNDVFYTNQGTGAFTYGSIAPTPDSPIDIEVVENEQIVNVSGKNLLKGIEEGDISDATGEDTNSTEYWRSVDYIKIPSNKTIYASLNNSMSFLTKNLRVYNKNKQYIGYLNNDTSSPFYNNATTITKVTSVADDTPAYIRFTTEKANLESASAKFMLFQATSGGLQPVIDTTYEPYQSQDYEIDLHGKNLFDINEYSNALLRGSGNNVELTKVNDTTLKCLNKSTTTNNYCAIPIPDSSKLLGKTVTASVKVSLNNVSATKIQFYYLSETSATTAIGTATDITSNGTYTLTETFQSSFPTGSTKIGFVIYGSASTSQPIDSYATWENIQIEENNQPTSYEPYYNYKLCKIVTHKDSIEKSTGKNLFDKNSQNLKQGYILNDNGEETTSNISQYSQGFTSVNPNTTYTLSGTLASSTNGFRLYLYDENKNFLSRSDLVGLSSIPYTFTTNNNTYYLRFQTGIEAYNGDTVQLEKNNQATDYEPYGTDWYLHKEIGKIEFSGADYSSFEVNAVTNDFVQFTTKIIDDLKPSIADGNVAGIINYVLTNSGSTASKRIRINIAHSILGTTSSSTNTEAKNALVNKMSGKTMICYYILEIPTNTQITDETLINQLEAIKVFTGSNYFTLSNSNNVLPNIYAKRLKKLDSLT